MPFMARGQYPGGRRAGSLGRTGDVLLLLTAVAYVAFVLSVFLRPSGEVYLWADLFAYDGVFFFAGLLMLLRGTRGDASERPWTLVGIGTLLNAVGGVLWSLDGILPMPSTVVAIPDLLWLCFYPLAFVALYRLARRQVRISQGAGWLDAVIAGSGVFTIGLAAIGTALAIDVSVGVNADYIVNATYLLGDLVLIAMVVMVAQACGWKLPRAWMLLLGGLLLYGFGDALYLVELSRGSYVEGSAIDVLWPTAGVLFGVAAVAARPLRAPDAPQRKSIGPTWVLVPSLAVLGSGTVLLAGALGLSDDVSMLPAFFAALTIVLGVIRLDMALRQQRSLAEELRESRLDLLTGLPNRTAVADGVLAGAAIALDIDEMAAFNDSLGFERADRLMLNVARRLRACIRSEDVVARVGGDEFVVLLSRPGLAQATVVAEDLLRVIEEPTVIDGLHLHVSMSAGVAASEPEASMPAIDLLMVANDALRRAKSEGPGLVRVQDGSVSRMSVERLQRRAEIRQALRPGQDGFVPYFQPIVSIADGSVLVCEALARWPRQGRILAPGDFMDDLVQSGSLPALTQRMLTASLTQLADAGLGYATAVNVPPELLTDALASYVERALTEAGVSADRLYLEVTETAILRDPKSAAAVLHELREQGVRVLLDDFGTGWSGLSSLRDLGIDGLKLDYSFVSRLATDSATEAIVRGIASVARDLGICVIYEGVEDPEVEARVFEMPTGYAQGFAVARPMPISDLAAWKASRQAPV